VVPRAAEAGDAERSDNLGTSASGEGVAENENKQRRGTAVQPKQVMRMLSSILGHTVLDR